MSDRPFLFESSRSFVIFTYSAGHGLLLLRSRKSNLYSKRLDVLIQDVRAMEIRTWFDGLKIEEANRKYLEGRPSKPVEMIEPGNRIYALTGTGWEGFIVGGIVSVREDDGEYMDPSALTGSMSF